MKISKLLLTLMILNLVVTTGLVLLSFHGIWGVVLPEYIPFHWSLTGEVDAFAPNGVLVALSALPLVIYGFMFLMPVIDPNRESEERHKGVFSLLVASFLVFFITMQWSVILISLGMPLNVISMVKALAGIFFLVVGTVVSRIQYNFIVGIRTPWTLASEKVWGRTHRMGGWAFFFLGIWILMLIFVPGVLDFILFFTGVLAVVGYLFYYSYREFKKLGADDLKTPL